MPVQARSAILLFPVLLLTFQRLGLGPNSDLGLDKSPVNQTKIGFFFMASVHKFFFQVIHSHTFRSLLSSANQLPELTPVQLSSHLRDQEGARSSTRLGTFQRSKASIVMYLELSTEIPSASRCLSKQIMSPMFQSLYKQYYRKFPSGFQRTIKHQNTQDQVLS